MSMLLIWHVACSIDCRRFHFRGNVEFKVNNVDYSLHSTGKKFLSTVQYGGTKGVVKWVKALAFNEGSTLSWRDKTQNVNYCIERDDISGFRLQNGRNIVLSTLEIPAYVPMTKEQLSELKHKIVQKNWAINPFTVHVYDVSNNLICSGFKVEATHVISNCSLQQKPYRLKDNLGNIFTVDTYEEAEANSSHYKVLIIKIKEQFKLDEIIAFDERLPLFGDRTYPIYKIDEATRDLIQIKYAVNKDDTLHINTSEDSSPIFFEVTSTEHRNYLLVSAIKIKPEIYLSTEYLRLTFEKYMHSHNKELFKFTQPTILTKEKAEEVKSFIASNLKEIWQISCGHTLLCLRTKIKQELKIEDLTAFTVHCPYNQENHIPACLTINGQEWSDHTAFMYEDQESHDLLIIDPSNINKSPFKITQVPEIYHNNLVSMMLTATGYDPSFVLPDSSKFLNRIYIYENDD